MNYKDQKNVYEVDEEMKHAILTSGRCVCPSCDNNMRLLKTQRMQRDEYYCEKCHASVPLFNRMK